MDTKRKSRAPLFLIVGVLAVGAFVAAAWNSGREGAMRDESFGPACQAASTSPAEAAACVDGMKSAYKGPLDDYGRVANASAQQVADYRAAH